MGIAIAAAATAPMLFMYSVACYFFGHVLVIAIMPVVALLVIEMTRRWTLRELLPCCAALGLTLSMMLFLLRSLDPDGACVPGSGRGWSPADRHASLGEAPGAVAASAASLSIALALAPQLSVWAVQRLLLVSGGLWGWPLSTFLPHEILGLGRNPLVAASLLGWVMTGVLLAGVTYVAYRERDRATSAVTLWWLVVGILASYALMTWHFGAGHYNAWKWIAYLQPLFCASIYSLAALGVSDWMSRRRPELSLAGGRDRRVSTRVTPQWVVVVGATTIAVLALFNTHRLFSAPMEGAATGLIFTDNGAQGMPRRLVPSRPSPWPRREQASTRSTSTCQPTGRPLGPGTH